MKNKNMLWILILFFMVGILSLRGIKSPEEIIKNYMKEKYNEEFIIKFMGKRDGEIVADVLPKKYLGTRKEYDEYYESAVFLAPDGDIGDNYGGVLLNESANEYFRGKLEELFGKNILPVLKLEGGYDFPDFKKEMEKRQKKFIKYPNGIFSPLSGGIYIFGRVESEADREHYRKQIYEFIQFLKAEGMFDYVDINFYVKDERTFLKEESQKILSTLDYKGLTPNEADELINKSLNPLNEKYNQLTSEEKQKILNSTNKSNPFKDEKGFLLLVKIASPKFVDNFFRQDLVKQIFDGKKEYNTIQDVKFKGDEF
ncbi:MAG: hypothetical protein ACRC7N_02405 [Clostridium sp.]